MHVHINVWQYYDELQEYASRWLENPSIIVIENFLRDMSQISGSFFKDSQIRNKVFDCFRKHIFLLIRKESAIPKQSCRLLVNYAKDSEPEPSHKDELFLRMFLSCFTRKQFDYFIQRYYFLDETVLYNHKIEKQISRYLKQRYVKDKLSWESSDDPVQLENMYVKSLDSIPDWFVWQIGDSGVIDWHPDAEKIGISMKYCRRSKKKLWVNLIGGVIIAVICFIYVMFF